MVNKITKEMEINGALLSELISLREKKDLSKLDNLRYNQCFAKALNKFSYIVTIHTNKYKRYSNYDDLRQEGLIGLCIALNKFDPQRSHNFFRLVNWYVKTRCARSANKYDVINVPMNIAKESAMNRVAELPVIVDPKISQVQEMEKDQIISNINLALEYLNDIQKFVVCSYYGINHNGAESISSIAKQINTSRANVEKILVEAYDILVVNENILSLAL